MPEQEAQELTTCLDPEQLARSSKVRRKSFGSNLSGDDKNRNFCAFSFEANTSFKNNTTPGIYFVLL